MPYDDDPFAPTGAPSISFKDAPVGTTFSGTVTKNPEVVQMRDFETGEPATWPDGNKKMGVTFIMALDGSGEERSVWAGKPSALFTALSTAQKDGGKIVEGAHVDIAFTGTKPNSNPRLNPQKLYQARVQAAPPADPWAADPAPQSTPAAEPAPTAAKPPWES